MSVIFISGFNINHNYWNIGINNKKINIQKIIEQKTKKKSVIININDYKLNINKYIFQLNDKLQNNSTIIFPIILVAHSFGGLYALSYANQFPNNIYKIILLDSTIPTEMSIKELSLDTCLINNMCKDEIVKSLIEISKFKKISNKIIFSIHINYNMKDINQFNDEIVFYSNYTNKNTKSNIIIYNNIGHMIHWKRPDKIINDIIN